MKRLLLSAAVALIVCSSQAQPIRLVLERNGDNSLGIYGSCNIYGDYTVRITLTEFAGYNCSLPLYSNIGIANVTRSDRLEVARFTPQKTASQYLMRFRYTYYPGRALNKVSDPEFAYLIPARAGTEVRVMRVTSVGDFIKKIKDEKNTTGEQNLSHAFVYHQGDTVCAARAGIVFDYEDKENAETRTELYTANRNRIRIEHKDGTLAQYSIPSNIKPLVGPGDFVVPGQPIAVFDKPSEKYQVYFSTYYLDEKKLNTSYGNLTDLPNMYTALPAYFSDGGTKGVLLNNNTLYTAKHPPENIALELTKRERKKLGL